jgi:Ni2+-binding GTPase involved in maturation of urease and hydrogenase
VKSQIASLNPNGTVLVTSSLQGDGVDEWLDLLRARLQDKRQSQG